VGHNINVVQLGFQKGLDNGFEKNSGIGRMLGTNELLQPQPHNVGVSSENMAKFQSEQSGLSTNKGFANSAGKSLGKAFKKNILPELSKTMESQLSTYSSDFIEELKTKFEGFGQKVKQDVSPYYLGMMAGQPLISSMLSSSNKSSGKSSVGPSVLNNAKYLKSTYADNFKRGF